MSKVSTGPIPCVGGERICFSPLAGVFSILVTDMLSFARDLEFKHLRRITSTQSEVIRLKSSYPEYSSGPVAISIQVMTMY